MSRPTKRRAGADPTQRPPVPWRPQTLSALRIVRRWVANEANDLRTALDEFRELEASGAPGAARNRELLEELYEYVSAQRETFDALIAPQTAEPSPVEVGDDEGFREQMTLDRALDVMWDVKRRHCRGVYRRELATAVAEDSPGATAGQPAPATRGREGESRQACEPAGPARGSRRAKAAVAGERGQAPRARRRAR
ncbi:hypothetical protein WME90_01815 [Sorangium sp. So ce375]|uniref:hypothetical protein n=1 Tax=Sorangium sp. So ce375 TaxID=3133306 RepID=UPI003F5CB344